VHAGLDRERSEISPRDRVVAFAFVDIEQAVDRLSMTCRSRVERDRSATKSEAITTGYRNVAGSIEACRIRSAFCTEPCVRIYRRMLEPIGGPANERQRPFGPP
jgi:hypothetical protein